MPQSLEITPENLRGRRAVVVGLGMTGVATAAYLADRGALVTGTDIRSAAQLGEAVQALASRGVNLELGRHEEASFTDADLVVLSPGVPPTIPALVRARECGVPITGEIELAARLIQVPLVAVTGTNGKTTTTSLVGEIFRAAGRRVFVGGNIGQPLIGLAGSGSQVDLAVVELSSFQLETAETFRPRAASLLNLTPDHMDRYPDLAAYLAAKARVFTRQLPEDLAVLNADDPPVAMLKVPGRKLTFSRIAPQADGAYLRGDRLVLAAEGRIYADFPSSDLTLVGAHNQENVMAALLLTVGLGVDPQTAWAAAAAFQGLPHRVEFVAEIGGVRYYDDSKGTNVGAVIKSLEGFTTPVILIAGGRDKEGDFTILRDLVREKVRLLILIGEAKEKMAAALEDMTETAILPDMTAAVARAKATARPGDVVLLSPACASFDQFDSYAHRGRVFSALVREARP